MKLDADPPNAHRRYMTAALFYDKEPTGLEGEALVVANCLVVREQLEKQRQLEQQQTVRCRHHPCGCGYCVTCSSG